MSSTIVKGSRNDVVFGELKAIGLGADYPEHVFMKPVFVGSSAKAPGKKSKKQYIELNLKLAFAPEVFKDPGTIHALVAQSTLIRVEVGTEKRFLSERGLELAEDSSRITQETLDKYPELRSLHDGFMAEWKAAYKRALAAQDAEENQVTAVIEGDVLKLPTEVMEQ